MEPPAQRYRCMGMYMYIYMCMYVYVHVHVHALGRRLMYMHWAGGSMMSKSGSSASLGSVATRASIAILGSPSSAVSADGHLPNMGGSPRPAGRGESERRERARQVHTYTWPCMYICTYMAVPHCIVRMNACVR